MLVQKHGVRLTSGLPASFSRKKKRKKALRPRKKAQKSTLPDQKKKHKKALFN